MHKTSIFILTITSLLISGCAGMQWYKGAVIQYTQIEKQENGTYIIEVLGSLPHSEDDLKSSIRDKASELCGSEATLIESHIGSYKTVSAGSGFVINGTAPKIYGIAKCN